MFMGKGYGETTQKQGKFWKQSRWGRRLGYLLGSSVIETYRNLNSLISKFLDLK